MGKSRGAQERGNEEKQQPEFSRGQSTTSKTQGWVGQRGLDSVS